MDASAAGRQVGRLVRDLADPERVADAYGSQLAADSRAAGQRQGVPRQAHLVAPAIVYQDGRIRAAYGAQAGRGTVSELLGGAEYGSDLYSQFGPHSSRGHWLWPTIQDPTPEAALQAGDRELEQLIRSAI